MILQRTIQNEVSTVGVGLHTGEKVKIILCPAPEGHGVVFQRDDITAVSYTHLTLPTKA